MTHTTRVELDHATLVKAADPDTVVERQIHPDQVEIEYCQQGVQYRLRGTRAKVLRILARQAHRRRTRRPQVRRIHCCRCGSTNEILRGDGATEPIRTMDRLDCDHCCAMVLVTRRVDRVWQTRPRTAEDRSIGFLWHGYSE